MIDVKNKQIKIDLLVFLSFVFLTILMTFPLILSMDSSVPNDKGDTLHNAWILSWTVHSLLTDPSNLFNSNIYYPWKNTFSYSEVQLTSSLIAMPILIFSNNPILAHNFVLILSFILSGFGTYLLVKYLTNDHLAGFISGLIFAFFPFKFAQLTHIQLLSMQWIPLSLLFLHKYFDTRSKKNLILFFFFFSLQVITIGYLTLFLLSTVFIYIMYLLIFRRIILLEGVKSNWRSIIVLSIFLVIFSSIFYLPYFKSYEYGYKRSFEEISFYGADLMDYLSVPPQNLLYGRALPNGGIATLFPGIIPIFLMLSGIFAFIKTRPGDHPSFFKQNRIEIFYLIVMIFGFLMSLGPSIKYMKKTILPGLFILFSDIPGFNGTRYIPAYVILVMLAICVLSGFGVNYLFIKFESRKKIYKKMLFLLLTVGILIEFLSLPVPIEHIATGNDIPPVYKWLSSDKGDYAIVEFPLPKEIRTEYLWDQFEYMYFSTYHWKKLVNGVTGYFPSNYIILMHELNGFPSERSIMILQQIKVKYVIIHGERIKSSELDAMLTNISSSNNLKLKEKFGSDYLYEIKQ